MASDAKIDTDMPVRPGVCISHIGNQGRPLVYFSLRHNAMMPEQSTTRGVCFNPRLRIAGTIRARGRWYLLSLPQIPRRGLSHLTPAVSWHTPVIKIIDIREVHICRLSPARNADAWGPSRCVPDRTCHALAGRCGPLLS